MCAVDSLKGCLKIKLYCNCPYHWKFWLRRRAESFMVSYIVGLLLFYAEVLCSLEH